MALAERVTAPIIEPAVNADWQPSCVSMLGIWDGWWPKSIVSHENVAGIFRALSFVAVPLFLVSLSGFLKQRGE